jgi:hypothetical protein
VPILKSLAGAAGIEVTAGQVTLSNHSTIDTTAPSSGPITFNVGTFSATDSAILAKEGGQVGVGP